MLRGVVHASSPEYVTSLEECVLDGGGFVWLAAHLLSDSDKRILLKRILLKLGHSDHGIGSLFIPSP